MITSSFWVLSVDADRISLVNKINLVWVLTQIYICAGHRILIWIWCQTIRFSCSRRLQFKWHAWWRCQGCHSHLLSWKGPTSKTDCRHADDTWIDCATWTGKECRSIHVCEVVAESASFMCKGLDELLDYGPLKVRTLSLRGTGSSESCCISLSLHSWSYFSSEVCSWDGGAQR